MRIAFDAPTALAEKIERLKEIHAHKLKDGSLAEVLAMAVDMLLDKADAKLRIESKKSAKKMIAAISSPTSDVGVAARRPSAASVRVHARRPPAAVQREVWQRDGGRCTFQNAEGKRCSARGRLQIDLVRPWAFGGSSRDAGNLRLLCQAHNLLVAERSFPRREISAY